MLYANIAVDNISFHIDKPYTYSIPEKLRDAAKPGSRVIIPFGLGNKKNKGIILEIRQSAPKYKTKPIISVVDSENYIDENMLELCYFIKQTTFCNLYSAVKLILPAALDFKITSYYVITKECNNFMLLNKTLKNICKIVYENPNLTLKEILNKKNLYNLSDIEDLRIKKLLKWLCIEKYIICYNKSEKKSSDQYKKIVKLTSDERLIEKLKKNFKRSEKYKIIYDYLSEAKSESSKELSYILGVGTQVINNMIKKGYLEAEEVPVFRNPYTIDQNKENFESEIILSEEQNQVYQKLIDNFENDLPCCSLLKGVTGSGKTLVYTKLIDYVLNKDKNIILLVPEIALTSDLINKFYKRYGNIVAIYHSGLSQGERYDEWKKIRGGDIKIVIGTRSAIFTPLKNIGLIIMDEEHDSSYKSDQSPKYHTRDIARFLCAKNKAMLLLLSATPCIESYYNALSGRYNLVEMNNRYNNIEMPEIIMSDMKQEKNLIKSDIISKELYDNIKYNLENHEQTILFINRRGYSTFLVCAQCGEILSCPHCSVSLTYHKSNNKYMCHYCGYTREQDNKCDKCSSSYIKYQGHGTQRIEEEITSLFPEAKILRMDADTTGGKLSHEKIINAFISGDYNILLGTQMIAKGLNFPNVSLVGVIGIDNALYFDDFRSSEKTFALLMQVTGRAGRQNKKGRAVIQSMTVDNEIFDFVKMQNYNKFYENEIKLRKIMNFPPFSDIIEITFTGERENLVTEKSMQFLNMCRYLKQTKYKEHQITILGPVKMNVYKINNLYRTKITIKTKINKNIREFITLLIKKYYLDNKKNQVNISVDINPIN